MPPQLSGKGRFPMRLNETQKLFARTMLDHPDAVANPDPLLAGLFTGGEAVLPERLKIYRNNIVGGLTKAMQATYPLIEKLTGEDFATGLFRSFVLAHPPQESCLARYGAGLDNFIGSFSPARGLPYLADIARFEWAMNEAYYAPDDRSLTPAALQNVPLDDLADMVLPLRTSIRLLESRWPLTAIRDFCFRENRDESEMLDLDQGGCRVMIYRPGLSAEIVPLEAGEYAFLQAIGAKNTLGDALEITLKSFPAFDFQGFLQKHLGLETFSATVANT